jgi:hypothetical protein
VDPAVALCPGNYGDPRGAGVSYERGTPATSEAHPQVDKLVGADAAGLKTLVGKHK